MSLDLGFLMKWCSAYLYPFAYLAWVWRLSSWQFPEQGIVGVLREEDRTRTIADQFATRFLRFGYSDREQLQRLGWRVGEIVKVCEAMTGK